MDINVVLDIVAAEMERADKWPSYNSAHEGFAVLLEEVDELKTHVWTKQRNRNLAEMRKEASQVAAVALRFMRDLDEFGRR